MTMPRLAALEAVWETSPPYTRSLSWLAQSEGLKVKRPKQNKNVGAALELAQAIQGM